MSRESVESRGTTGGQCHTKFYSFLMYAPQVGTPQCDQLCSALMTRARDAAGQSESAREKGADGRRHII